MSLIKNYKQTLFTSRLIAFFVIIAFCSIVAWYYHFDVITVAGVLASLCFLSEITVFHTRLTLTAALTAAQVGFISMFTTILYTVLVNFSSINYSLYLGTIVLVIGVFTIIITLIGNYVFSSGRLWINTLFSYIIYDGFLLGLVTAKVNIPYILSATIALSSVIIYILLRHFVSLHKQLPFNLNQVPTSDKTSTFIHNFLMKKFGNAKYIQSKGSPYLVFVKNSFLFVLLPIAPKKYFTIINNNVWVDSNIVTGMFESIVKESRMFSKSLKINQKQVVPILFTTKKDLSKDVTILKIRSKRFPDKLLGRIFVVNKEGLNKLLNKYQGLTKEKKNSLAEKSTSKISTMTIV